MTNPRIHQMTRRKALGLIGTSGVALSTLGSNSLIELNEGNRPFNKARFWHCLTSGTIKFMRDFGLTLSIAELTSLATVGKSISKIALRSAVPVAIPAMTLAWSGYVLSCHVKYKKKKKRSRSSGSSYGSGPSDDVFFEEIYEEVYIDQEYTVKISEAEAKILEADNEVYFEFYKPLDCAVLTDLNEKAANKGGLTMEQIERAHRWDSPLFYGKIDVKIEK